MVKAIRAIILFADIRGSTEFGYTQSLEMHNRMLRDFHKTCYEAIERFRQDNRLGAGRVIAACRGDECCVFLSGGKTPEDELLAMNLAIYLKEMWKQSDFCRRNWQAADTGLIRQVDLRVGIGSGEVALDHDVWSRTETLEGVFISEAKRIEEEADAASETLIMVKWDIREACIRAEAEVEFGPPIPLKGKGVPPVSEIPVYPVEIYAEWKAIQKKLVPSPDTYFERFGHAVALHHSGDVEAAIREYGELLKVRSDDPAALYNRGVALHGLKRHEEALADYNRSLQLRPDHPATLNNRGVALDEVERYEEALADYNRSLELRPDDPGTLNNRGNTLGHLKRNEEALTDYNRSLEFRPDDPTTLCNRGNTLDELKRYEEALADYNRSLELRPDDPGTLNNRGFVLTKLGRPPEALADLDRSLEIRPDDLYTLSTRALALAKLGQQERAFADFARALAPNPTEPHILYDRACALSVAGRWDEALHDLAEAIAGHAPHRASAREDNDLEPLRNHPERGPKFWELVETEE